MYKKTVLNAAIDTALNLPRQALWTATAVTVVFSLEAGITIVGDTLDLKTVGGTPTAQAATGVLENGNFVGDMGANALPGGIAVSAWVTLAGTAADPPVLPLTGAKVVGGVASTTGAPDERVVYASEIFRGTVPDMLPTATGTADTDGSNAFQVVCHTISGVIKGDFTVNFNISGAQFANPTIATGSNPTSPWAFAINGFSSPTPNECGTKLKGTYGASTMKLDVPASLASCTLEDGAQVCLVYKLGSTSALKTPGTTVTISTQITQAGGGNYGTGGPVIVAESKQGANFTLESELSGEVYITASSGNKEFSAPNGFGGSTFISATESRIGYIKYKPADNAKSKNGSAAFSLGDDTADAATLVIENGQFSASPGGSSAGRVYLSGVSDAIAAITVTGENQTATFNLDSTKLEQMTTLQSFGTFTETEHYTPIVLKVDGQTEIKDTEGGDDPQGKLTVTMGTAKTNISDTEITSALRRIPYDGKVCTVYNIPSPTSAADVLTLRITNDSDQAGAIRGTLYNEAGEEIETALDLLAGHLDYTKNPPLDRATLGFADPLQLQPRETVILTSVNIATVFGIDPKEGWPGERYVLKILSTIPRIEVFNLLRNVENITLQPLSNVSSGATGVECSPIP
jgi:hypothetical protein